MALAWLFGVTPGLIDRLQWIALHGSDRDVIAAFKLVMDVLVPVGSYVPRSQYALTPDKIALGDVEIEDLPDVAAADIEDIPDVVA
jgi:hypothetical protein